MPTVDQLLDRAAALEKQPGRQGQAQIAFDWAVRQDVAQRPERYYHYNRETHGYEAECVDCGAVIVYAKPQTYAPRCLSCQWMIDEERYPNHCDTCGRPIPEGTTCEACEAAADLANERYYSGE